MKHGRAWKSFGARRSMTAALVTAAMTGGLSATAIGTATTANAATSAASTQFYSVPSPLPSGTPGTIIKTLPSTYTAGGTSNVSSTRIMYLSTGESNAPIPVTGDILVPQSPWTGSGPRPIVGYAPFTFGLGQQCAPSETLNGEGSTDLLTSFQNNFVKALLAKGYAVAETDYVGEGETNGPGAQFVMRVPQGDATLDVLRAALKLPNSGLSANAPLGIVGYSEGGNAAAAAAELAKTYAPELNIAGIYAGAVPANLGQLASTLDGSLYTAFLGDALVGMSYAYPSAGILGLANQTGVNDFKTLMGECTLNSVFSFAFQHSKNWTTSGQPVSAFINQAPFNQIIAQNDLGKVAPGVPIEVESAPNDDVIPNSQVVTMAKAYCAGGGTVQYNNISEPIPFLEHVLASSTAATDAANYMAERFAGKSVSNCGKF